MDEVGIAYEALDAYRLMARWPQLRVPDGTLALFQTDGSIVPAGRTTAVLHERARRLGAELRDHSPVLAVEDLGDHGMRVTTTSARSTAGASWSAPTRGPTTSSATSACTCPLEVTLEQVTYFAVDEPDRFAVGALPLWIWMDDPSFYGFPTYGENTVKAAQDCGGPPISPDDRTSDPDPAMEALLADHVHAMLPGVGAPLRSVRCQYTLTADRDFVLAPVPGHERVVVGLGAAHAFKFVPTFGRVLADLVTTGTTTSDVSAFRLDRPAVTEPDYAPHWLV